MRAMLLLFIATVICLMCSSCVTETKVLVTPLEISDYTGKYIASPNEIWEMSTDDLKVINTYDTVTIAARKNGYWSSYNKCVIQKIAD